MISDEILMRSWAIAARHLARGQRDPTLMIADAIAQERGLANPAPADASAPGWEGREGDGAPNAANEA